MNKVELAKMLGLRLQYKRDVNKWSLAELIVSHWNILDYTFNADIVVTLEQGDLSTSNLDISEDDLIKPEDIKVCIEQCDTLLWERAADKYLEKIANIVETLKV